MRLSLIAVGGFIPASGIVPIGAGQFSTGKAKFRLWMSVALKTRELGYWGEARGISLLPAHFGKGGYRPLRAPHVLRAQSPRSLPMSP